MRTLRRRSGEVQTYAKSSKAYHFNRKSLTSNEELQNGLGRSKTMNMQHISHKNLNSVTQDVLPTLHGGGKEKGRRVLSPTGRVVAKY